MALVGTRVWRRSRLRRWELPEAFRRLAMASGAASSRQPAPQQPSEIAVVISGDPGTPPRYAVPDFVALDARRRRGRQDDQPGAVGRPGVRARVLPDPARHLRHDSAPRAAPSRCRSPRGASSAPTPSSSAPCSARATTSASRCGCSTSARGSRCSPRNTPAPPPTRGSTRTPSPTRSTSSSARCAASRARSWRSPPTATASAWSARSRTATSRRSTSPTTTARTRGASRRTGS